MDRILSHEACSVLHLKCILGYWLGPNDYLYSTLVGLCLSTSHVLTFIEFNWPYLLPAANQQTVCSSESERFENLPRCRNLCRLWMPLLP